MANFSDADATAAATDPEWAGILARAWIWDIYLLISDENTLFLPDKKEGSAASLVKQLVLSCCGNEADIHEE